MSIFFAGNMIRQRHGIFKPPVASGYTWVSSQGLAWYNNVLAAGASITNANQAAFDTAFQAIYANSVISTAIVQAGFLLGFSDGTGGSGSALNGCFVPIVGSAPTNVNFVSSDFSRTGGLTKNSLTKYINTNRANNADAQDSRHIFASFPPTQAPLNVIGSGTGVTDCFITTTGSMNINMLATSIQNQNIYITDTSVGLSRATSSQYRSYSGNGGGNVALKGGVSSNTPSSSNITLFALGGASVSTTGTLIFYSSGSAFSSRGSELLTLAGINETLRTSIT
jgi:hypothetical protein